MGGKESKLSYISYEESLRRVKDVELKRIKDAFKRSSSFGGYMPDNMFAREVLGDGVPLSIAQVISNDKHTSKKLFGLLKFFH
ncbi:hypothetical protein KUTeg_009759 [Tegillarca granosa]|uniref:Uncharacterized protein n=1 Tax=Tegillarca granosa TaxID=220873 RepID=A0ABQ9F840_TEGGR|nr:hypothetical protein KUTeg_009759 [Tegillarca granosa]